jgi:hypothetical protein
MSSEANETKTEAVAKQAPTEQQESSPGVPKRFTTGQTVCNEKNEKGKLCNGHLKEQNTQHPSEVFLRGDDVLYRCQTCGALYMGPPMGHVRDPRKQRRYVERDLAAILQAAGGTLPAYDYPAPAWRGTPKARSAKPAASSAGAKPSATAPAGETPEQKKARLVAEHKAKLAAKPAPSAATSGGATEAANAAPVADSSPSADSHRPAAEAQAATGQASAAPLSPTAATASPAAGAETVSDLAPEASTELTPGAPRDERPQAAAAEPGASATPKPKKASGAGFRVPPELQPKPGETTEEKLARLKRISEEAKRRAGKL